MHSTQHYDKRVARLETLMANRMGFKNGPLDVRVARARRRLPRAIKRDMLEVARAAHLSGNPRIAPQIDRAKTDAAYKRAVAHMHSPAVREQHKTFLLGVAGGVAFNVLMVCALLFGVLVWQGAI